MTKQKSHAEKERILRTFNPLRKPNQKILLLQIIRYSYSIFKNMNFNIC
jgi:hypothetical protein